MKNQGKKNQGIKNYTLEEASKLYKLLKDVVKNSKSAKDEEIILMLGDTGAGKSTLITYLMGYDLEYCAKNVPLNEGEDPVYVKGLFVRDEKRQKEVKKLDQPPVIGYDSAKPETIIPKIYKLKNGDKSFDSSGFKDKRDHIHQVAATIGNEITVKNAKKIKSIVILINYNSMYSAKGAGFDNTIKILTRLFKDTSVLVNSATFVLTNPDDIFTDEENIRLFRSHCNQELRQLRGLIPGLVGRVSDGYKQIRSLNVRENLNPLKFAKSTANLVKSGINYITANNDGYENRRVKDDNLKEEAIDIDVKLMKKINILTIMANSERVIVAKPKYYADDSFRDSVMNVVNKERQCEVDKSCFDFSKCNIERRKFTNLLQETVKKFCDRVDVKEKTELRARSKKIELESLKKKSKQIVNNINKWSKYTSNSKNLKTAEESSSVRAMDGGVVYEMISQDYISGLNQKVEILQNEINETDDKIGQKREELFELERKTGKLLSDSEVLEWKDSVYEERAWWIFGMLTRTTKNFKFIATTLEQLQSLQNINNELKLDTGGGSVSIALKSLLSACLEPWCKEVGARTAVPIAKVVKDCENGYFKTQKSDCPKGVFKAKYYSRRGYPGKAKTEIFAQMKNVPENLLTAWEYIKDIKRLEEEISDLHTEKGRIEQERSRTNESLRLVNGEIQNLKTLIRGLFKKNRKEAKVLRTKQAALEDEVKTINRELEDYKTKLTQDRNELSIYIDIIEAIGPANEHQKYFVEKYHAQFPSVRANKIKGLLESVRINRDTITECRNYFNNSHDYAFSSKRIRNMSLRMINAIFIKHELNKKLYKRCSNIAHAKKSQYNKREVFIVKVNGAELKFYPKIGDNNQLRKSIFGFLGVLNRKNIIENINTACSSDDRLRDDLSIEIFSQYKYCINHMNKKISLFENQKIQTRLSELYKDFVESSGDKYLERFGKLLGYLSSPRVIASYLRNQKSFNDDVGLARIYAKHICNKELKIIYPTGLNHITLDNLRENPGDSIILSRVPCRLSGGVDYMPVSLKSFGIKTADNKRDQKKAGQPQEAHNEVDSTAVKHLSSDVNPKPKNDPVVLTNKVKKYDSDDDYYYDDHSTEESDLEEEEDDIVVESDRKIMRFDKISTVGDGWCGFNAIDVEDPKSAMQSLIDGLKNNPVLCNEIGESVWHNCRFGGSDKVKFETKEPDLELNNIEEVIKFNDKLKEFKSEVNEFNKELNTIEQLDRKADEEEDPIKKQRFLQQLGVKSTSFEKTCSNTAVCELYLLAIKAERYPDISVVNAYANNCSKDREVRFIRKGDINRVTRKRDFFCSFEEDDDVEVGDENVLYVLLERGITMDSSHYSKLVLTEVNTKPLRNSDQNRQSTVKSPESTSTNEIHNVAGQDYSPRHFKTFRSTPECERESRSSETCEEVKYTTIN